jgi:hypothetical protein
LKAAVGMMQGKGWLKLINSIRIQAGKCMYAAGEQVCRESRDDKKEADEAKG